MEHELADGVAGFHADICRNNVLTMVATGQHKTANAAREAMAPIVEALQGEEMNAIEVLYRSAKGGMELDEIRELMAQLKALGAYPILGTIESKHEFRTAMDSSSVGFVTPVEDAADWLSTSAAQGKIGAIRQPNVASVVRRINDARGDPPVGHMPASELAMTKISPWQNFSDMSVASEAANARYPITPRDDENTFTVMFTGHGFDEDVGDKSPEANREVIDWVVQNHGRMPTPKKPQLPNKGPRMKSLNLVGGAFVEDIDGIEKVVAIRKAMQDAIDRLDRDWTPFPG